MPPSLINNLGGPKGFGTQFLAATDDGSTAAIDITRAFPGGLTLFGTTYRQIYVITMAISPFPRRYRSLPRKLLEQVLRLRL